ncbi:WXG100 family type VII secretion target [Saccharopolyspora phatthalungensis]|uniref:Uncharacterized protein YukE n=1 Tax=Saccharopolyspora phatthalungensis TaxID=664693 RepID=A0A840PQ90_9PSEU|nr:hypothetical protein [Saccharopolyspora phatthalungensis]MBB5152472.1 uncharacterized protein YukE [Saccharopolyspora phatthalungensis]
MSDFFVRHSQYSDVNQVLAQAVGFMGSVLEELNTFLKGMGEATQGQAAPLWQEQQVQWNKTYTDMHHRLNTGHKASNEAQQIFQDGDRRGAAIFG